MLPAAERRGEVVHLLVWLALSFIVLLPVSLVSSVVLSPASRVLLLVSLVSTTVLPPASRVLLPVSVVYSVVIPTVSVVSSTVFLPVSLVSSVVFLPVSVVSSVVCGASREPDHFSRWIVVFSHQGAVIFRLSV